MDPNTQANVILVTAGLFGGMLCYGLVAMIRAGIGKTRPWALLADEEGGRDFLGRVKMGEGKLIHGKGETRKEYPVAQASRRNTNEGPLYVLGRQTGVNLSVPSKDDIQEQLTENQRSFFHLYDPLLLAKVTAKSMAQSTVQGQLEKDDWKKSAILPLSIVAGLLVVGLVVVVAVLG